MDHRFYLYLLVAAVTTYAIRALPLTLIRREIQNPFLRSFLYYVPYVTLSVMAFPAIITATSSLAAGLLAFAVAAVTAWLSGNLFLVAAATCISVYVCELLL